MRVARKAPRKNKIRRRYILIAFAPPGCPPKGLGERLRRLLSKSLPGAEVVLIRSWEGGLILRCGHRALDGLRAMFPMALAFDDCQVSLAVAGVSGTLRRLRRKFIERGRTPIRC